MTTTTTNAAAARRGDVVAIVTESDIATHDGYGETRVRVEIGTVTNVTRAGVVAGYRIWGDADGRVHRVGAATRGERYLVVSANRIDTDAAAAAYAARGGVFDRAFTTTISRPRGTTAAVQSAAHRRYRAALDNPAAVTDARDFLRAYVTAD